MTIERLREVLRNHPFHAFTIHLADGRNLDVVHPEFVAISPSGRTAVVYTKDDSSHHIDLLLVTDLEVKSNGHRRRKAG